MSKDFFAQVSQAIIFRPPPDLFDVIAAKAEDLRTFGLGDPPDPSWGPARSSFWTRMFQAPITFVAPEFPRQSLDPRLADVLGGLPLGGEQRRKPILRRTCRRI